MILRDAKSTMYSGKQVSSWQQALVHVYDLPPMVLLTILQLSAIALPAKMFHDTPSKVPQKVHCHSFRSGLDCCACVPYTASKPYDMLLRLHSVQWLVTQGAGSHSGTGYTCCQCNCQCNCEVCQESAKMLTHRKCLSCIELCTCCQSYYYSSRIAHGMHAGAEKRHDRYCFWT